MIIRRILISILSFLFLISTTGLPVSYHYCKMMQEKLEDECKICQAEVQESQTSCCSKKINDHSISIYPVKSVCCKDEFIYNKIEDNFLSNKSEGKIYFELDKSFQQVSLLSYIIDFPSKKSFYYFDSSPPFLIDPDIYITNLALII